MTIDISFPKLLLRPGPSNSSKAVQLTQSLLGGNASLTSSVTFGSKRKQLDSWLDSTGEREYFIALFAQVMLPDGPGLPRDHSF